MANSASWKLDPKGVFHGRQTKNEIPHERATQLTLEEGNLDDVLTVIFYHVDELYNQVSHLVDRCVPNPTFSDSEMITLTLVN